MNPDQVLITVPTRGSVRWETITRLQAIRDVGGYPPICYLPGNLSVAQTRNRISAHFDKGNPTTGRPYAALVMVDDDVVPSPQFLDCILDRLDEFAVVALPHPMPHPQDPSRLCLTVFNDDGEGFAFRRDIEEGLHECDAVATGCIVISATVLRALGSRPFRITDDPFAPVTSDDFEFCRDVRAAGFRIGYWYDGWFADHVNTASLAPLLAATTLERSRA